MNFGKTLIHLKFSDNSSSGTRNSRTWVTYLYLVTQWHYWRYYLSWITFGLTKQETETDKVAWFEERGISMKWIKNSFHVNHNTFQQIKYLTKKVTGCNAYLNQNEYSRNECIYPSREQIINSVQSHLVQY